jgi:hypothetical protein
MKFAKPSGMINKRFLLHYVIDFSDCSSPERKEHRGYGKRRRSANRGEIMMAKADPADYSKATTKILIGKSADERLPRV